MGSRPWPCGAWRGMAACPAEPPCVVTGREVDIDLSHQNGRSRLRRQMQVPLSETYAAGRTHVFGFAGRILNGQATMLAVVLKGREE